MTFELESEIERRRILNSTQIGIGFWRRLAVRNKFQHARAAPAPVFHVTVHERHRANFVVTAGWQVPPTRVTARRNPEATIIDAILVLIPKHRFCYRRWIDDLRRFGYGSAGAIGVVVSI